MWWARARRGDARATVARLVTHVTQGGPVTTTQTPIPSQRSKWRRDPSDPAPQGEAEALASVEGAEPVGLPTPRGMVRGVVATFAQPRPLAREILRLGGETVRI